MSFIRPQSLFGLTVFSFILIAIPLLVTTVITWVYIDRMVDEGETALSSGVETTEITENIAEEINEMGRNARQYVILGDEELLALLNQRQRKLDVDLAKLRLQFLEQPAALKLLEDIKNRINQTDELLTESEEEARTENVNRHLSQLGELVETWKRWSNQALFNKTQSLQEAANNLRQLLIWGLLITAPLVGLLIIIFSKSITRPFRSLSDAINRLKRNDYQTPIEVTGPQDIKRLGIILESLRVRLDNSQEQQRFFLRHMSHELKTPLASLLEGTEMFVDGSMGYLADSQQEVAEILSRNTQEMRHLIENLLDYNALMQEHLQLDKSSFALRPLIDSVTQQHHLAVLKKLLQLQVDLDSELEVYADRRKFRTIIDNLLSNAIKYSPPSGKISIWANRENDKLVLQVADEGPNIPQSERDTIFQPFYTGQPPVHSHLRGSGIGLSLTLQFVRAHSGTISLCDGQYPGAHFIIEIPQD